MGIADGGNAAAGGNPVGTAPNPGGGEPSGGKAPRGSIIVGESAASRDCGNVTGALAAAAGGAAPPSCLRN